MLKIIISTLWTIYTGVIQRYGMEYLEAMLVSWRMPWKSIYQICLKSNLICFVNWYENIAWMCVIIKQLTWHMGVCFECLHAHLIFLLVCSCACLKILERNPAGCQFQNQYFVDYFSDHCYLNNRTHYIFVPMSRWSSFWAHENKFFIYP